MEQLVGRGTRYIGVSNFSPKQLDDVLKIATIKPKTVQIELHPYLPQTEYVKSIQAKGITVTAYSPLANTNPVYNSKDRNKVEQILAHQTIQTVATARGCTPAQVVLAWNTRRKVVVIPKAAKSAHRVENIAAPEKCKLTDEDDAKINDISKAGQARMNGRVCQSMQNKCWEGLTLGM